MQLKVDSEPLPVRWKTKKLGEVCLVERGSSPRPIERYLTDSPDGVNWVKIGDTKNVDKYIRSTKQKITKEGAEKSRRVEVGDFILSNSMSFGKPYVMATSGYVHDGWFILKLLESIDIDFFHYLLASDFVQAQFIFLAAGSVVKNISKDLVKKAVLPIPPLAEQKRIVTILDEVFEGCDRAIRNTENNLANAREIFESYLNDIFTQKGKGWVERKLEEISECVSVGHVGETSSFYCDENDGIPFVRSQNVRPRRLELDGVRYITKKFHAKLKKSRLISGDLLFVRVGVNRGDCCSVPANLGELNCANIVFARPREGLIDYLEYYCQSKTGRSQLMRMTTGSAQGVINTKSVAELLIPFPHID